MDELRGRFQRLDRIAAPNLWNEAVGRAAEMPMARRWTLSPTMGLLAVAVLLAAMAGTMAVGAWLNDRLSPEAEVTTYENGMLVTHDGCGGLVGLDPVSFAPRDLVATPDGCRGSGLSFTRPVAWSADGSRLAYWSQPSTDDGDIWLYEAATGVSRPLNLCERLSCDSYELGMSRDGQFLAYVHYEGDHLPWAATLFVQRVDSDQSIAVSLSGSPRALVFSPDGHYVAFSQVGGRSGVYLVDVSRFEEGVLGEPILIHGIVEADELAWSPDSRWIVMTQTGGLGDLRDENRQPFNQQIRMSGQGIVIVSANGTQSRVLATLPAGSADRIASPRWSADSQTVAYITSPVAQGVNQRSFELWTVPIEDGEPTRIHAADCCVDYPTPITWSPDGEWIVFGHDREGSPDASGTFIIRPDGSGLRRIAPEMLDVVWQPIRQDD